MMNTATEKDWDLEQHYARRVKPALSSASWTLRVTEHADRPVPVFIVKEQLLQLGGQNERGAAQQQSELEERGLIYGQAQRRCLPVIREIVSQVTNDSGIPLELDRFLGDKRITFRGNLPLDEEAGCKLSLIFRLRERILEMDRVELIARRVQRFTREEAAYWYSRTTNFGEAANRWARAGMRTMLGGQPGDPAVEEMLMELRSSY
jgi:hypothetical protein